MAFYKNTASQKVSVLAVNPTTGSGVTGDASNITAQISKDGGSAAATNDTNPTELNATHHPGVYLFDLTQAETNANMLVISTKSTTHPVAFDPVTIFTTDVAEFKADVSAVATTSQLQGVSGVVASTSQLQGVSGVMATTSQLVGVSGKIVADIDAVPTAAETYAEFISGSNEDAFKANVSALATTSQLQGVSGVITATRTELGDAATLSELQGVSGVMAKAADVATTSQLVGVSGKIVADIDAVPTAAETYAEFISGTNENAFKADVTALATTSQLQGVSGVITATRTELADAATLSELQGVSGVMAKAADVATTSQLVGVSGKLVADIDAVPTAAETYAEFISGSNEDAFKANVSALATTSQLQGVSGVITATRTELADAATLSELQGVSGVMAKAADVATTSQLVGVSGKLVADIAAVPTAAETYAEFISGTNENAFKADVSALATTSQLVGVSGSIINGIISTSGVSGGASASAIYTYFTDGSREDAFKADVSAVATTSQLQGVSGVVATTSQLVGVSGKIVADIAAVPTASETYAEFISGTNENAFKADVTALATTSQLQGVSGVITATRTELADAATLSELQGVSGVMAKAADVATTSQLVGVSGKIVADIAAVPTAAETYAEFVSGTNENAFKADVTALATTSQLQGVSGVMLSTLATTSQLQGVSGIMAKSSEVTPLATTSQLQGVSGAIIADISTVDTVVDAVKVKSDQLVFTSGGVNSTVRFMNDNTITAAVIAPDAIGPSELASDSISAIADQVWDENKSGHTTANTYGKILADSDANTASGVVTQLNNTTYDSKSFEDIMKVLLSMAQGKIVESPTGTYEFYAQNNSTVLFTLTRSGNSRTRS